MDQPARISSATTSNVADRLRQLAQGREALDVAQFQFVGLEGIRAAYGERWAEQKDRIHRVAEEFLRRRMDASDLLISAGGGFVIVFSTAAGVEAEAVTGQLSHDLNDFFLGEVESVPALRFGATCNPVSVEGLAHSLGGADVIAPRIEGATGESPGLAAIEWRYQPVWDVRSETLSCWYVSPHLRKTGTRLVGYQFENQPACASQFAAIDEACLWVSEQAIKELIERGKQALIGVSIHARTLANQTSRARIVSVLGRLDRQLFRYRVVKIAGIAPGFPRLYLAEIVQVLKARGLKVVIGAAWDEPDIAGLLQAGPLAVGVALPPLIASPGADASLQTLIVKLGLDVQRAHAAKARFFVEGDVTPGIAMKLRTLGIDSISSSRIWPALATPDAMLRWAATRLAA